MSDKSAIRGCITFATLAACVTVSALQAQPAISGERAAARHVVEATRLAPVGATGVLVAIDREALVGVHRDQEVLLRALPLPDGATADLELKRFYVTQPGTRFVIGRKDAADVPLTFDPESVVLLRGKLADRPGSSVFLSLRGLETSGAIRTDDGRQFAISASHPEGATLSAGHLLIYEPRAMGGGQLVPLCGADSVERLGAEVAAVNALGDGATNFSPQRIRQLQLAVDTDHEYFELFGSATDAAAYLLELYGAVSDIYLREIGVYVTLSYVRVWDSANDLYNSDDPLTDLQLHWINNMGFVERDTTQLLSGRRDYAYGGIAYVGAMCNSDFGYSAVGYAIGSFPDPSQPHIYNYDIHVTAHELGHNCGTGHTHAYGLDACHDPNSTPRRGSIMSYCSQTWSGGNANGDNHFHRVTRQAMLDHMGSVDCFTVDCNLNGIDDSVDISTTASPDVNGNGIPDECEDCDSDGILDPVEIAGSSNDVNLNGVPDECETDCDNDGQPDEWDIRMGQLADVYGDGIPDICELDCDGNKFSDYSQIQTNMPLDIDRDARLDSCRDCDNDGQSDIAELSGAHDLWMGSGLNNQVLRRFYSTTGVRAVVSTGAVATLNSAQDVLVTADGRVLVSSAGDDRVAEFTRGVFVRNLVFSGSGGLDFPAGLAIAPSGNLLVASRNNHRVLAYDITTGAFAATFVSAGSGGLVSPHGLTLTPQGHLLVTSSRGEVLEYDGLTGAFRRALVSIIDNGGLSDPRGMTFKPDGNLLVASFGNNLVLEYDGVNGLPLGPWAKVGTVEILNLVSPWSVRVGPNGNVYVSRTGEEYGNPPEGDGHDHDHGFDVWDFLHLTQARAYEFDLRNGNFIRTHVAGNDHGLHFATGMAFLPGWETDCNWNQIQDSCDIASGTSSDANADNIPDDCQTDCNNNGQFDRLDLIPHGTSPDCNFNRVPDECDVAQSDSPDLNGNGRPDECDGLRFESEGIHKSRYISFETPTAGAAGVSAIRVILTSLYRPTPDDIGGSSFAAFEGQVRWVGPPVSCADHVGAAQCAVLQCTPHYQDWSPVGLLSVTGDALLPSSAYTVQMVPLDCTGQEAECGLEGKPLIVRTARWGDMVPNFQDPTAINPTQPDVLDISATVDVLKEIPTSIRRVRAQLQPNAIDPQTNLQVLDLSEVVDAVKGGGYSFSGPSVCP